VILNIENIKAVYINLEEHTEKNNKMIEMLKDFRNVERYPGIGLDQKNYSRTNRISMAHRSVILNNYKESPLIIFEDDCVKFNYKKIINVPDDADIVFLGSWLYCDLENINNDISKVSNTRGAHAILYVSKQGKDFMLDNIEKAIEKDLWHDYVFGENLKNINAYMFNFPLFYQTSKEEDTKIYNC
jgi:hypothetical protein